MNALDEARNIVTQRMVFAQARQIRALQIQQTIMKGKLAVATLWREPMTPIIVMTGIYLVASFIAELLMANKSPQEEPCAK